MADVESFYDELAEDYHVIYADWHGAVRRQGAMLDRLVRSHLGDRELSILDCSCGIGTQAIGLALHGHTVRGTDISSRAVERARREATKVGVDVDFGVADMRTLANVVPGRFDVVLSCDNSLPHLLTNDDLQRALENMRQKVHPGGLVIVGIRDYDQLVRDRPQITNPVARNDPEGRTVVFQLWDWHSDGRTYTLTLFVLKQHGGRWDLSSHTTRYRALVREELRALLAAAGFTGITWHEPESTGHHQPLITARS